MVQPHLVPEIRISDVGLLIIMTPTSCPRSHPISYRHVCPENKEKHSVTQLSIFTWTNGKRIWFIERFIFNNNAYLNAIVALWLFMGQLATGLLSQVNLPSYSCNNRNYANVIHCRALSIIGTAITMISNFNHATCS